MELGCIADDLTGASDLANELASNGLEAVLVVGDKPGGLVIPEGAKAVVVALKSRSINPALAIEQSLKAMCALRAAGARRFYFKYCSTFDSTPQGNIGPVLEALAQELDVRGVIACPAFPATGRTVYNGYLFVGDQLLSESGMRDHPLNPMTDSNLVRVLQAQSVEQVGLVRRRAVVSGALAESVAERIASGQRAVIADAVDDADLRHLGAYCATVPLSTGGSGLGAGIARAIAGHSAARASALLPEVPRRRAIVSGSCSQATRRQLTLALERYPSFRVRLGGATTEDEVVNGIREWIDAQMPDETLVIYSTSSPDEVEQARRNWPGDASEALERILGAASAYLVESGVRALVVAGGETSGAAVHALGCTDLAIGPEIAPGVPWCITRTLGGETLLLALKSGNFGDDQFMITAWDHLA